MMGYELKEGQGSLFRNETKKSENSPDYGGSILIDGTEYWLSGWLKEGQRGKWLSLSARPKEAKPAARPDPFADARDSAMDGLRDDVPF